MTDWMPEWLLLIVRVALRLGIIALIIFTLVACFYYHKASKFDIDKVAEEQLQNTLIDQNGIPLKGGSSKHLSLITKDDLPQHLIDALIAREDASFETHHGVDIKGLIRATVRNIKDLSFTQGASTISMQLTRNTYGNKKMSLNRKFLEIALTLRIEANYSKREIMAYYLNRIYFGSGCYGIEQASQKYFKKPTRMLNLSESATLAGIIRGPHIFSPLRNLKAAEEQRNQVLDRMVVIEKLDSTTAEKIKATPLVLPTLITVVKNSTNQAANGYAMQALERHLNEILEDQDIRAGGLTIKSSLNLPLLHQCENDIKTLVKSTGLKELQAACVILDHTTGGIRALIGGADFRKSAFNRALDSKVDLGDVFTPFIYSTALERSKLPIKGRPVQTGRQLKTSDTIRIAKRFGLNGPFNEPEVFYGSGVTTPLELTTAFAALANKGLRPHTYFIESITTHEGEILFSNNVTSTPAVQEGTARETMKLLKTRKGTTFYTTHAFNGRALWSIASRGQFTAVLWVGFDKAKPVPNRSKLLSKMEKVTRNWVN